MEKESPDHEGETLQKRLKNLFHDGTVDMVDSETVKGRKNWMEFRLTSF